MIRAIHRAKYVLAESDLLLQNAAVYVSESGRISRVEPWGSRPAGDDAEFVDWGSAVIIPGLVNAHTHLELTRLHEQLTEFTSFTDWLGQLLQKRSKWTAEDHRRSVLEGVEQSLSSGTTLVGDISASGESADVLRRTGLRKVVFREVLGLMPERAAAGISSLDVQSSPGDPDPLLKCGFSPHAPYSTAPNLYQAAAAAAALRQMPLATHLAETEAEGEFLRSGSGEFRNFLAGLGALPSGWNPPGLTPVAYLDSLGVLQPGALLIHCNYLDRDSMAAILRSRSSVAYCPRSHAFFNHKEHPVRQLLDLGVNVALGTDSLASNSSLSILEEMRFLSRERKDLKCSEIIRMATLNGASALHFGGVLGRLRRGYWADMTVLCLPEDTCPKYLISQILAGAGECVGTIVQGDVVWQKIGIGCLGNHGVAL